jgi:hypothetical protein
MIRTSIEILIILSVVVGAYFIYLEKVSLNQKLGFKDLAEQQLTKQVTQLKLTNRRLSDSESLLQSKLKQTEQTLLLIKQSARIPTTDRVIKGQIQPGNIYSLLLDNNNPESPELGVFKIQSMDKVEIKTSDINIDTELLISREGKNQYRVLSYSSVKSGSNNKSIKLNNPTGEAVVNLDMMEKEGFKLLKWYEGFQLGVNTGKQGTVVKTVFKYGDINLLGLGVTLTRPTGYVEFINLPIYKAVRSSLKLFPNTNIGVGLITSEQLPVISLSFSL